MTNEEIQKYIEQNCRYVNEIPAMDEQAFYEGAKWMRDKALSLHNVSQQRELLLGYNEYLEGMYNAQCLEDDDVDLYLKTK